MKSRLSTPARRFHTPVRLPAELGRWLLLLLPLMIASCAEKGSDAPHPATLYDICEVASADPASPVTLYLYQPDSDTPVTLTAPAGALGATPPDPGTPILAAYIPANGQPYTDSPVTITNWAAITDIPIAEAKDTESLDGWDTDPVYLLSAWRAGGKICMRLRLPYSAEPRRFALLTDPSTLGDPIPTAYLYHRRPSPSPTYDRQYYIAFDITTLWALPSTRGLRIRLANTADPSLTTLLFTKSPL